MAIPKQSNCVCEKPRTAFAGNTDCPSLKSSAKHPPIRYGWMRKTASLPATMSTVPMCGRQWSSAEPPTINTVSTDTYAVITGTMTQNAITIKADGEKTELVTLFNVDIQMSSGSAIKTTGRGAVTLELNGTNIAKSNTGGAGTQKMNTDWLVIQDNTTPDGSLTAAGGDYTAGIGGS